MRRLGAPQIGGLAGEYDQRVTVWKDAPTTNADGQRVENSTEVGRRWCSIHPLSGRERFMAQQAQADVTHRVRMRSDTLTRTIRPTHWLTMRDGTRLDIERVFDIDMRKIELELQCNERA